MAKHKKPKPHLVTNDSRSEGSPTVSLVAGNTAGSRLDLAADLAVLPVLPLSGLSATDTSPVNTYLAGLDTENNWKGSVAPDMNDVVGAQKPSGNTSTFNLVVDDLNTGNVETNVDVDTGTGVRSVDVPSKPATELKTTSKSKCTPSICTNAVFTPATNIPKLSHTVNLQMPAPPGSNNGGIFLAQPIVNLHMPVPKTMPTFASLFASLPCCAGNYSPCEFSSEPDNPSPPAEIVQEGVGKTTSWGSF